MLKRNHWNKCSFSKKPYLKFNWNKLFQITIKNNLRIPENTKLLIIFYSITIFYLCTISLKIMINNWSFAVIYKRNQSVKNDWVFFKKLVEYLSLQTLFKP